MRICFVLLSPTFGMHQYTADLANRMVDTSHASRTLIGLTGHEVHLVTTNHYPSDRYAPDVLVHTPISCDSTGFDQSGVDPAAVQTIIRTILRIKPDLVHITGPHLWNIPLLVALRRAQIPVTQTIHDLVPHPGSDHRYFIYLWNTLIRKLTAHLLVHGLCYRRQLLMMGSSEDQVTYTPLLHLFLGYPPLEVRPHVNLERTYEPYALFFGRFKPYKGIPYLLRAWQSTRQNGARLVLAGPGTLEELWAEPLPPTVEVRNRIIQDQEALDLFRRCSLVVLPYTGATQSALIAAAYYFNKPVIVSQSGALPEYVLHGQSGWVVPAGDAKALGRYLQIGLADPARLQQMGEVGRAWYEEKRRLEERSLLSMYIWLRTAAPVRATQLVPAPT
jgi:glycosyltransferase involved in cell wall biosynthesis